MRRKLWLIAALFIVVSKPMSILWAEELKAMDPAAHPTFEVASIRQSDSHWTNAGFQLEGRRVVIMNENVERILIFAYNLHQSQIAGLPEWARNSNYVIEGIPNIEGQPNVNQIRNMVKALLAERFHLTSHAESRVMSVYVLKKERGGPKFNESKIVGLANQSGHDGPVSEYKFTRNKMEDLVSLFKLELDKPVLDQTGLTGIYDFDLKWSTGLAEEASNENTPSIFTAVREQLGLSLEPAKESAPILVVDHLERPTVN